MKTKVNTQWYNQTVAHLKNGIANEKLTLRMQFYRYRDAINGNRQAFDVKNNIDEDMLFEYLNNAVHSVGKSEVALKKITTNYEPDVNIKVNWKEIDAEIKSFSLKNNGILSTNDDEFLEFVADFFCEPRWGVPDTEKNNDRLYSILSKYQCCDDELCKY